MLHFGTIFFSLYILFLKSIVENVKHIQKHNSIMKSYEPITQLQTINKYSANVVLTTSLFSFWIILKQFSDMI